MSRSHLENNLNLRSRRGGERLRAEGGFYVVFASFMFLGLLLMVTLAIEVGRLLIAARQLQNGADAAALAGAQRLKSCNPGDAFGDKTPLDANSCDELVPPNVGPDSQGGWQAVKPAVIASLSSLSVLGRDIGQVSFSSGPTYCDDDSDPPRYGNLRFSMGSDPLGALSVQVLRQMECRNGSGGIGYVLIDGQPFIPGLGYHYPYCFANSVQVVLTYRQITLPLAKLFGVINTVSMSRTAVASVRQPVGCLNVPPCANLVWPSSAGVGCPLDPCVPF